MANPPKGPKPKQTVPDDAVPQPPAWGGAGVPEPIGPEQDSLARVSTPIETPITLHDERAFMQECADRLNGFIQTYPDEAEHLLMTFLEYEHEMIEIHLAHQKRPTIPGVTLAYLICALLQTHQGNGWVLRPILIPDPDHGVGVTRIVKFIVKAQEPLPSEHTA